MQVRYSQDLKHAEFNGIEFCRWKDYFINNKYGYLHRYIYEYHNNFKIPDDYVVHHKDFNKLNNDINNLVLMTNSEHNKLHSTGKILSEETKKKMSDAKKGKYTSEKNPKWIPITDEMIFDYKNGIKRKDFCSKYNVSQRIWDKIRRLEAV